MSRGKRGRKLLIAAVGVAAVAYACQKNQPDPEPVGNLVAPEPTETADPEPLEPDPAPDAGGPDEPMEPPVGNLMPPDEGQ